MSDLMIYMLVLRFYEFKILFIRILHSNFANVDDF